MRGLTDEEAELLSDSCGSYGPDEVEPCSDREAHVLQRLLARGLVATRREHREGWWAVYFEATPLGRIALACHAATRGIRAA